MMLNEFIPELNVYLIPFYKKKLLVLKTRGGFWEFPGGGVEYGEHPEHAALRETKEETGLDAKNISLIGITSAVYPKDSREKHSVYIIYKAETESETFILSAEHEDGKWITPEELDFLKLGLNAQGAPDFLKKHNLSTAPIK